MYICHTLISVGTQVAHVYRHEVYVVGFTQMQALHEWTLMEPEQSLCDCARTRKRKQRATTVIIRVLRMIQFNVRNSILVIYRGSNST